MQTVAGQLVARVRLVLINTGAAAIIAAAAAPAMAQDEDAGAIWGLTYKGDIVAVDADGGGPAGRYLDNIELTGEFDFGKLAGWEGARGFVHVLSNSGAAVNDLAGTLQGINNIEVARPRAKIYQAWLEQSFAGGKASVLAGLYDLNSEFYQTEAAGLLLAPAFGIGSELAATGPNGPSIFPSTSLALRGRVEVADGQQLQAAVLNANAGVFGDPDGVDFSFDEGLLAIAEYVVTGPLNIRAGVWRYTQSQDDIRDVDALGDPLKHKAQGVYVAAEGSLWRSGDQDLSGFVRLGASDGRTTSFAGGWQAGVLLSPAFVERPDSAFSFGVNQGLINKREKANFRDAGIDPTRGESAIELTYADKVWDNITLQPDLQVVFDPGADRDMGPVVAASLRVIADF